MTDLNLKEWRQRHGNISQRQLSEQTGYCQQMLSRYERGVAEIPDKFRLALAALSHGLTPDDVYCNGETKEVGARPYSNALLVAVMEDAVSIVFALQTYAFDLRRRGEQQEADRLLKVATNINGLFYKVGGENER